jgi:hypothetical protein
VISTLFFSRTTPFTASATDEVVRSVSMSTPPVSHHWRAIPAPMSGLFWWSAGDHIDREALIPEVAAGVLSAIGDVCTASRHR